MAQAAERHRRQVAAIAPKMATAAKGVVAAQRTSGTKELNLTAQNAALRAAVLPQMTTAVQTGAQNVATVAGTGTPSPTTTLAGALSYKFADQFNQTTQGQLDDLTTATRTPTTTGTPVDGVYAARHDLLGLAVLAVISNALNAGATNYASTLTSPPDKTWEVTDDNPCPTCQDATGETVAGTATFSNGAPHGPIHPHCQCTLDWTPATSSSQRSVRMDSYEEWRAQKYSADDMKDLLDKGKAMKNASGDPSYPVADKEDIENAIHAVGRGGADHDAIRAHIIAGAKKLNLTSLIPDNWNADGSLSTAKSADPVDDTGAAERDGMVTCSTCTGSGKIREGNVTCPTCKGTGKVLPTVAETTEMAGAKLRRRPRRQKRSLERLPEWRTFRSQFERRVAQDGNDIVLTGVPIRYASPYEVHDWAGAFRETMHRGVADEAMQSRDFDCRFLINHEGMPLARTASGTLTLTDTPKGLRSEAHLDARSSLANDLALAVERGDVSQMSCGFVVATGGDDWRMGDDGIEERDVLSFDELFDVSAVTYPASPTTSIELAQRAMARASMESRERMRRLWEIAGTVRSGSPLTQHDGEELREMAERLYRMEKVAPVPELLGAYAHIVDRFGQVFRAGKVLSGENEQMLQEALDALHAADDIDIPGITKSLETIDKALDAGQAGLAAVLGKANPDGGKGDENPTLVSSTSPASDKDADAKSQQARQLQHLELIRRRSLLAKAV